MNNIENYIDNRYLVDKSYFTENNKNDDGLYYTSSYLFFTETLCPFMSSKDNSLIPLYAFSKTQYHCSRRNYNKEYENKYNMETGEFIYKNLNSSVFIFYRSGLLKSISSFVSRLSRSSNVSALFRKETMTMFIAYSGTIISLPEGMYSTYKFKEEFPYKIHMCLAVKRSSVMNILTRSYTPSDFCLLVDVDSFKEAYKSMYFSVFKRYITPLQELGVDVVYTNNIDKWVHNPPELRKTGNLADYINLMDSINDMVFDYVPEIVEPIVNKEEVEINENVQEDGTETKTALSEQEAEELFTQLLSENSSSIESEEEPGSYF